MGYAGYGNHSDQPQQPEVAQEDSAGDRPPAEAAPAAKTHEPENTDPLLEVKIEQASFARIEPGLTPPWRETSPHRRDGNPTVSHEATREISTPAEGAGPLPTEGDDVDPGLG